MPPSGCAPGDASDATRVLDSGNATGFTSGNAPFDPGNAPVDSEAAADPSKACAEKWAALLSRQLLDLQSVPTNADLYQSCANNGQCIENNARLP